MRRLQLLINAARRQTDNEDYDSSSGISDEEFIQYANDAQDDILAAIHLQFPMSLVKESTITLINGQESYDLPSDIFLNSRLVNVEFAPTGNLREYYKLKEGTLSERFTGYSADPSFYIRRSGSILLQPTPKTGFARINYQYNVPRLDIRLAKVGAVTLATSSITSLTFDTSYTLKDDQILEEEYFSVVSKDGVVKMQSIPISSIDVSTGVVTIVAGFTFDTGETIAVGDYICRGKYGTTHSQLPDICEQYIYKFLSWKILKRDSSGDSREQTEELLMTKNIIVESFKLPDGDVSYIPIIDSSYLDDDTGFW